MKKIQFALRVFLGGFLLFAGISHIGPARQEFRAQVPTWLPLDADFVVVASGVVEIGLGVLLISGVWRVWVGLATALFLLAIFPGNISQWVTGTSAFGLNTDEARLIRLFFQPVLVVWVLWSTGAWGWLRGKISIR
jgi:uncharacterized membrane protein